MKTPKKKTKKQSKGRQGGFPVFSLIGLTAIILALSQKIPLANTAGDHGNAYYSVVLDFNLLLFVICGAGLMPAVKKMVNSRRIRGQFKNAGRTFYASLLYSLLTGILLGVLSWFASDFLAEYLFSMPLASVVFKCAAPIALIVGICFILQGYFSGMGTTVPGALTRTVGFIALFAFSFLFIPLLGNYGEKIGALLRNSDYQAAYAAAGGVIALLAGVLISLLLLFVIFMMFRSVFEKRAQKENSRYLENYRNLFVSLMSNALLFILCLLPLALSRIMESVLFMNLTEESLHDTALTEWGVYSGKVLPFILLPAVCACFYLSSRINMISRSMDKGNHGAVRARCYEILHFSVIAFLPVCAFIAVSASPLINLLYTNGEIELAVRLLPLGAALGFLMTCAIVFSVILYSMRQVKILILHFWISFAVKVILLFVFTSVAKLGIYGVLYSGIAAALVLCVLHIIRVMRSFPLHINWIHLLAAPVISLAISIVLCIVIQFGLNKTSLAVGWKLLICLLPSLLIYLLSLLITRAVSQEEWRTFPAGNIMIFFGRLLRFYDER